MNRVELAEKVMEQHRLIAFSDDVTVASSGLPVYDNSLALLVATIKVAYSDVDTFAVYDIWSECNESIAYCVDVWRRQQIACGELACTGDCKMAFFLFVDDSTRNLEICLPFHTKAEYREMRNWLDANLPVCFVLSGDC